MPSKTKVEKAEERAKRKELLKSGRSAYEAITRANELPDPLSLLPDAFARLNKGDLDVKFSSSTLAGLDQNTIDWAYTLTERNMKSLYQQSSLGWCANVKREEMTEPEARYVIARMSADDTPVAMSHFRFDTEDGVQVLYCYELQVEPAYRRRGLGRYIMRLLELISLKAGMSKVMATVFKFNTDSMEFFKKLGYSEDETSPEDDDPADCGEDEDPVVFDYAILSKATGKQAVKSSE